MRLDDIYYIINPHKKTNQPKTIAPNPAIADPIVISDSEEEASPPSTKRSTNREHSYNGWSRKNEPKMMVRNESSKQNHTQSGHSQSPMTYGQYLRQTGKKPNNRYDKHKTQKMPSTSGYNDKKFNDRSANIVQETPNTNFDPVEESEKPSFTYKKCHQKRVARGPSSESNDILKQKQDKVKEKLKQEELRRTEKGKGRRRRREENNSPRSSVQVHNSDSSPQQSGSSDSKRRRSNDQHSNSEDSSSSAESLNNVRTEVCKTRGVPISQEDTQTYDQKDNSDSSPQQSGSTDSKRHSNSEDSSSSAETLSNVRTEIYKIRGEPITQHATEIYDQKDYFPHISRKRKWSSTERSDDQQKSTKISEALEPKINEKESSELADEEIQKDDGHSSSTEIRELEIDHYCTGKNDNQQKTPDISELLEPLINEKESSELVDESSISSVPVEFSDNDDSDNWSEIGETFPLAKSPILERAEVVAQEELTEARSDPEHIMDETTDSNNQDEQFIVIEELPEDMNIEEIEARMQEHDNHELEFFMRNEVPAVSCPEGSRMGLDINEILQDFGPETFSDIVSLEFNGHEEESSTNNPVENVDGVEEIVEKIRSEIEIEDPENSTDRMEATDSQGIGEKVHENIVGESEVCSDKNPSDPDGHNGTEIGIENPENSTDRMEAMDGQDIGEKVDEITVEEPELFSDKNPIDGHKDTEPKSNSTECNETEEQAGQIKQIDKVCVPLISPKSATVKALTLKKMDGDLLSTDSGENLINLISFCFKNSFIRH
jgi:hypothetical protein